MMDYYHQFLDEAYSIQMPLIEFLQNNLSTFDEHIVSISEIARPDYVIAIIFPIIAAFNTMLAAELLFANLLGNWSNLVLKWIFNEGRPFWWINEYENYKNSNKLRQYPITCETGPGFPSGHVTSSACTLFVIGYFMLTKYKKLKFMIWFSFIVGLILVTLSRMYVLAHFPHQCFAGALIGAITAYYAIATESKWNFWKKTGRNRMIIFAIYLAFVAFAAYWIIKGLGVDPQGSIKLAFKWCDKPGNIHVTTTPFYGIVSTIGSLTGFGIISPIFTRTAPSGLNPIIGIAVTMVSSACLFLAQQNIPTHSALVFYTGNFLVSLVQPILLLGLIPKVAGIKKKRN